MFFLVVLIALAGRGSAQHMNAKDAPCQGVGSGAEQTGCFLDQVRHEDTEMNVMYNKVRGVLSPAGKGRLQVAQRLWIQFRDANCEAERALYAGGSAAPMVHAACLAAVTKQRTAELNVMYGFRFK